MITVGSIFLVGCGESSLENSKYLVAGLDWGGGGCKHVITIVITLFLASFSVKASAITRQSQQFLIL